MKNSVKYLSFLFIAFFLGCASDDDSSAPTELYWEKVSAGDFHTLAIRSDGTLWAWGQNHAGQVGDGTLQDRLLPVQIGSNNNWNEVSAGSYHSLALTDDGKLWAWGGNDVGQVGDGTGEFKTTPTQIGNDTWEIISAGHLFTTALKSDGTVWGWGYDISGGVGDVEWTYPFYVLSPKKVGNESNWTFVTAGSHFVVARKSNGTFWGWGSNSNGELGIDYTNDDTSMFQTPFAATNVAASGWDLIVAGQQTLGLKADGKLYAWGDNGCGQFGNGTADYTANSVPIQIGNDIWKFVAAGDVNTAAIKSNGTLWSWGCNSSGSLGIGNSINQSSPVQVGTDSDWKIVSLSTFHGLAIKEDNSLWSWGHNITIGDGLGVNTPTPVLIPCPQ